MEFTLTPELTDRIIFCMEDQNEDYVLDTRTLDLLPVDEISEEEEPTEEEAERYVAVPEWTPADGFRLMERFVDRLRNPVYRRRLAEALSAGRGVFRRFKDTVKERPEIERMWYSFKDQAMREEVTEWYNDLRETWGLERVAVEPPEIEDLVLTDFTLKRLGPRDTECAGEIRRATGEQAAEQAGEAAGAEPDAGRILSSESVALCAEAPDGTTVAAAWAEDSGAPAGDADAPAENAGARHERELTVRTLYVQPDFRGLGLGRLLLERLVDAAREEGWSVVTMDLSGQGLVLDESAVALGFETVAKRMSLDLGD
jgi:GNAT superfamily N-acetyltransferase